MVKARDDPPLLEAGGGGSRVEDTGEPFAGFGFADIFRSPLDPQPRLSAPAEPAPERITGAALRYGGKVYSGPNHVVASDSAYRELGWTPIGPDGAEDGFITSTGRFVSRAEANNIARASGQMVADPAERMQPGLMRAEDMAPPPGRWTPGPSEALPTQHPARIEFEQYRQLRPQEEMERLRYFYQQKAAEMAKPPAQRIQPRPTDAVIDTDYATPGPEQAHPDLKKIYPRHEPGAQMPLNDRTRPLIANAEAIAQRYAQYIRDYMRNNPEAARNTGRFYRVDGPIYRAARKYGLSHEEALQWLHDFSNFMAATSPRTQTEPNALNASSAMVKAHMGLPHRQLIGPGSTAVDEETGRKTISETGYPMMTGKGGIHGKLLDLVTSGESISHDTNTKPSIFGPNLKGNRSGVTVDTHIIRGMLLTLNDIQPGAIPMEWILPKFQAAYQANPEGLTSDMLKDTLMSAQVGPRGASVKRQVEYPVFSDILHRVARILRVPQKDVADVQSLGWFGMGHRTNLGSNPETVVDILNNRISVGAQMMGVTPDQFARMLFNRKIPLASLFGMAVGAGMLQQQQQPDQQQAPADDIVATMTKAPRPMAPAQFHAMIDYMRGLQAPR